MLRVVILEDEYRICKMIEVFLDWEAMGIQIVGTADNGADGLDMILDLKPDIVIADIRIPEKDGIQVIRETIESGIPADFIIISGYRHFEYAHEAIKLGVQYFLLKPLDEDEMRDVVLKIRDKRNSSKLQDEKKRQENTAVKQQQVQLRKSIISMITSKNNPLHSLSLPEINARFATHFQEGIFCVFILKIDSEEEINNYERNIICTKISDMIEGLLPSMYETLVNASPYDVVGILNYQQDGPSPELEYQLLKQAQNIADMFHPVSATLCFGYPVNAFEQLNDSFYSALQNVQGRIISGTNCVLHRKQAIDLLNIISELLPSQVEQELIYAVNANDICAIRQNIRKQFSAVCPVSHIYPAIFLQLCEFICISVLNKLDTVSLSEVQAVSHKLYHTVSLNKLEDGMVQIVCNISSRLSEKERSIHYHTVQKSLVYIKKHFSEQISLNQTAEAVELSPAYFSSIFKREMKQSFSDYLTQLRIDEAKLLLRTTNLHVREISGEVGFIDDTYFSKLFHKRVGIRPLAYRKLYMNISYDSTDDTEVP